MKAFTLALFATLFCTAAQASTLIPLYPPAVTISNVHWAYCSASSFTPDGRVAGVCQWSYGSAPRGHASPTVSYFTTWDLAGAPTKGDRCTDCTRLYYSNSSVMINDTAYFLHGADAIGDELVCSNALCYVWRP